MSDKCDSAAAAFKCKKCEATFSSIGQLNRHARFHSRPRFQCDQCDKRFHQNYDLSVHMRRAHENLTYTCERCATVFASRSACDRHVCNAASRKRRALPIDGEHMAASGVAARRVAAAAAMQDEEDAVGDDANPDHLYRLITTVCLQAGNTPESRRLAFLAKDVCTRPAAAVAQDDDDMPILPLRRRARHAPPAAEAQDEEDADADVPQDQAPADAESPAAPGTATQDQAPADADMPIAPAPQNQAPAHADIPVAPAPVADPEPPVAPAPTTVKLENAPSHSPPRRKSERVPRPPASAPVKMETAPTPVPEVIGVVPLFAPIKKEPVYGL